MILFLIITFNFLSFASSREEIFTIANKKITFTHYPEERITISEKCASLEKNVFCKNIDFLKTLHDQKLATNLEIAPGGANPGAVVCNQVLKGIVVMGVDEKGNENSFCKMPDGLLIDSGTLTYYSSAKR
jgi:putative hemolysin